MSLFLNPWRPSIAIRPPSIVFRSNEFSVLRIAGNAVNSLALARRSGVSRKLDDEVWILIIDPCQEDRFHWIYGLEPRSSNIIPLQNHRDCGRAAVWPLSASSFGPTR